MRPWILYSALRLGLFLALFALLYALTAAALGPTAWVVSAVGGAVIALCISYIFLKPIRDRVALSVANARTAQAAPVTVKAGSDEDAEDGD